MWCRGKALRLVRTEFLISILRALAVPSGMGVRFTSPQPGRNFFNAAPLTFGASIPQRWPSAQIDSFSITTSWYVGSHKFGYPLISA